MKIKMILYPQLLSPKGWAQLPTSIVSNPYQVKFWRELLERVSVGEAPFGTTIRKNHLTFQKEHLNLIQAQLSEVVLFFIQDVGLQLDFTHFSAWKEIKRKVIRDNLVHDFVLRSQQQHQLDTKEAQKLLSLIHLYLTIKRILPHEIHLETHPHMYIEQIEGISFRNGKYVYTALKDRDTSSECSSLDYGDETDCLDPSGDFDNASDITDVDEVESIE